MPEDDKSGQAIEEDKRQPQDIILEMYQRGELFRPIDEIRKTAKPPIPLWGDFFFRKAVTSVVGDPGISKTTMGYGLAKSLCLGLPFLEIKAEEPVNVLYLDFESSDSLVLTRSNLVIGDVTIPNFIIYNYPDFFLSQIATLAVQHCRANNINFIIIDNQTVAFNTRDENDNAEGGRQMRFLRSFANACDAAVLIYHHTSKANLPGTRKGSGAFVRARLADIYINLETPDEEEYPNIIRFEVAKNRIVGEQVCWYIEKKEGNFILLNEPPLGMTGRQRKNTAIYQAQQAVLTLLGDSLILPRKDILLSITEFDNRVTQDAIDRLKQLGRIHSPKYGYYQKR